ncbi:MAG TPA: hypothetical protein VKC16_11985 [Xanthobacteraceae bacterium]|nr:hypothetical protein [Xanthobacteraceae bacterium]
MSLEERIAAGGARIWAALGPRIARPILVRLLPLAPLSFYFLQAPLPTAVRLLAGAPKGLALKLGLRKNAG